MLIHIYIYTCIYIYICIYGAQQLFGRLIMLSEHIYVAMAFFGRLSGTFGPHPWGDVRCLFYFFGHLDLSGVLWAAI